MASKKRSRCNLNSELDSELPELGPDSAHLNIDCDINPKRVVGAAYKAARTINNFRRPKGHSGSPRHKESHININYNKVSDSGDGTELDEDEDDESD